MRLRPSAWRGVLYVLVSAGLIRLEAPATDAGAAVKGPSGLRVAIARARELAEDGTYHAILGVTASATARQLAVARAQALEALEGDLEWFGLEALAPARVIAVEAIEEAYEVLSHPRWRSLYESAPRPRPRPGA